MPKLKPVWEGPHPMCLKHQFYYDYPPACGPKELHKVPASHEMEMKRCMFCLEMEAAEKRQ